jgi:hypothetical protein
MEKIYKSKIMFEKWFGKFEGRGPCMTPCRRRACNIKMDVKRIGFVEWTELL